MWAPAKHRPIPKFTFDVEQHFLDGTYMLDKVNSKRNYSNTVYALYTPN